MTLRLETLCHGCVHFRRAKRRDERPVCLAFPDGIPEAIDLGGYDHRKPYPGDNGVRFEPIAYQGYGQRVVEGYEATAGLLTNRASGGARP